MKWLLLVMCSVAFGADEGKRAYETTLFKLVRSRCTHCHDGRAKDDGISGPGFAVADLDTSYSRIRKYVRFDDVGESKLVRKGGNLHCLKNYGFNCATEGEEIRSTIAAWWEAGEKLNQSVKIETPAQAVGKPSEPKVVSWDLSAISGSSDLKMEMQVQSVGNGAGAYRFWQPRLVGSSDTYHVKTLRFVVNGKDQTTADMFHIVDRTVNGPAVLSPLTAIVLGEKEQGDEIAIRFDGFSLAEPLGCQDVAAFEKDILPVMEARDCFSCHGGGREKAAGEAVAKKHWNMDVDSAALCAGVKERSDLEDPNISSFTLYALQGVHKHPQVIPFAYELEPEFTAWVRRELGAQSAAAKGKQAPPLVEE